VRIEVSSLVEGDLDEIADYIAQDNPRWALSFLREIREQILALGRRPLRFRLRTELEDDARVALVGRYGILFRIRDDVVRVERVVYVAHDLLALFPEDE
jgi:plasmid stabilization system protein ParE